MDENKELHVKKVTPGHNIAEMPLMDTIQNGTVYELHKYGKPTAVLLPYEDYEELRKGAGLCGPGDDRCEKEDVAPDGSGGTTVFCSWHYEDVMSQADEQSWDPELKAAELATLYKGKRVDTHDLTFADYPPPDGFGGEGIVVDFYAAEDEVWIEMDWGQAWVIKPTTVIKVIEYISATDKESQDGDI